MGNEEMVEKQFAQQADREEALLAVTNEIVKAEDADGWMVVVWAVRDGRLYLNRITHKFPRGDFAKAEEGLRQINADDAAEDLAVAMALPLPLANRGQSPAVASVGELNGRGETPRVCAVCHKPFVGKGRDHLGQLNCPACSGEYVNEPTIAELEGSGDDMKPTTPAEPPSTAEVDRMMDLAKGKR